MKNRLIIAIDGPSGAGKSTLSKKLAEKLAYTNIDTGAMYRCVALAALKAGIDMESCTQLEVLCRNLQIHFQRDTDEELVFLDGEDVSVAIRTPEISRFSSKVAACSEVRQQLVYLQREMGKEGGVVLEGRDVGTVIFPDADLKFFLTADARERGRRRYLELVARGENADLEETIQDVIERDRVDASRAASPLIAAENAILVDATDTDIAGVLRIMLNYCEDRISEN